MDKALQMRVLRPQVFPDLFPVVGPLIPLVSENFQDYQGHDRHDEGSGSEGRHNANAKKETVNNHLKISFPSDHIKTPLDGKYL